MSERSIHKRLAQLESRVAQLQQAVRKGDRPAKNWRRTIGAYTDDAGMQAILQEAMRLRESDRQRARGKRSERRQPRR
jgi:hypothetical protein